MALISYWYSFLKFYNLDFVFNMGLKEIRVAYILLNPCLTGEQQKLCFMHGVQFLYHARDGLFHKEDELEVGR